MTPELLLALEMIASAGMAVAHIAWLQHGEERSEPVGSCPEPQEAPQIGRHPVSVAGASSHGQTVGWIRMGMRGEPPQVLSRV